MASSIVMGRTRLITTADNNNTLILGDAMNGETGAVVLEFVDAKDAIVPGTAFSGTITVKARSRENRYSDIDRATVAETPLYLPVPYRSAYLNGAVGAYGIVTTVITTTSLIHIPASALFVALDITCSDGFGYLYWTPVVGAPAI